MTTSEDHDGETKSPEALERIRSGCREFESALKRGEAPSIVKAIADAAGAERAQLLNDLVFIEIQSRRERGESPQASDYQARFPEWAQVVEVAFVRSFGEGARGGADLHGDGDSTPRALFGSNVGPYKLLDILGQGGMGIVYLAEQAVPIRRRVALKVIKLGMDTKEVVARFEAERQALALLNHPNIARVFAAGATEDGRPYFAMEPVEGVSLIEYCDRHRLGMRERLELFCQVCQGVQHAHEKGIIHRDLKPSNILVSSGGEKPIAKIIDFGVAKATNLRLTEKTIYTEIGRVVGTPSYMSPEQAEMTAEAIDPRADVYSLGVILYELLVGELPLDWTALSRLAFDEVLRRIREDEPPTPSVRWTRLSLECTNRLASNRRSNPDLFRRDLHGDLDWITMKAIEKDRDRRYRTAAHLEEEIHRHLHGEPVLAGAPSVHYRVKKYVRKHKAAVLSISAILLALTAGLITSVFFGLDAREKAVAAKESEERTEKIGALGQARLEEVLRLADVKRLQDYNSEAEDLWPSMPEKIPAMESWLEKAEHLARRLETHKALLTALRAKASPFGDEDRAVGRKKSSELSKETWRFAETELQWQHDTVFGLVTGIERFSDPDPHKGAIASVRKRLEYARSVEKRTVHEYRDQWAEIAASLSDPALSPRYGGLKLQPQLGLIPLGRAPESGFWEFAHLETGKPATRGADGKLNLTEGTGLVFILIPGGTFRMGSQRPSPEEPMGSPNVDPASNPEDSPVNTVMLDPLFLSKYEMTQGQWLRVTGENPSAFPPGGREAVSLLHPVEQVSWETCKQVLLRIGLVLPTEAQWEYASRGGTTTVRWTGDDWMSLRGMANMADQSWARAKGVSPESKNWPQLEDGYAIHAPIGTFPANPFGLHEILGNVVEWCRDAYGPYTVSPSQGDGERNKGADANRACIARGGGFNDTAPNLRAARRPQGAPGTRARDLGVRPAMVLVR